MSAIDGQILADVALKVRLLDITGDGVEIPHQVSVGLGELISTVLVEMPQKLTPQHPRARTFGLLEMQSALISCSTN